MALDSRSEIALPQRISQIVDHAEKVNERTNAFSIIDREGSLERAEELAQTGATAKQLLFGEAVTVKDSMNVPGLPRWHGSASHPGALSTGASVPVQRLNDAGAVLVAKTTMPDYGLLASGLSSQYGIIRNPWDLLMSPGGSSAGAAICAATGVTRFSVGTDIAGSVRLPAAHCGISALKPTQGGLGYAPASTWRSAGPMARTIADVRTLFSVLCGPAVEDQLSLRITGQNEVEGLTLRGLRAGVIEWPGYGRSMDTETAAFFDRTLQLLSEAGAVLVGIDPGLREEDFAALDRCLMARCLSELAGCPPELRDRVLPQVRTWAEPGLSLTAADYYTDFEHLSAVAAQLAVLYDSVDVIVSPVMGDHRFAAEDFGPDTSQALLYHTNFTCWYNQTGQPAVALPMGLSDAGHPIGLQIVGQRFEDYALLNVAESVERLLDVGLSYPDFE